jgi:hypothetical protein
MSRYDQHFLSSFCADILAQKKFNPQFKYKKVAGETFVQKSCTQNVGEIDSILQSE